jgi:hypothetical protein
MYLSKQFIDHLNAMLTNFQSSCLSTTLHTVTENCGVIGSNLNQSVVNCCSLTLICLLTSISQASRNNMAFPSVRTVRATASVARCFSSSASSSAEAPAASASKRPVTRRQPLREFNMSGLDEFQFDDATSLGFMRLEKIREAQEIIRRVEVDRPSLQGALKSYCMILTY